MEQELTEIQAQILSDALKVKQLLVEASKLLDSTTSLAKEHKLKFKFPDKTGYDDDEEDEEGDDYHDWCCEKKCSDVNCCDDKCRCNDSVINQRLIKLQDSIEGSVMGLVDSVGWNSSSLGC